MKPGKRTLAILLIVTVIIIIGAVFLTFYWEDIFFGENEEIDIPLQVARSEVIKDIEAFKMRKLVRENRGLILRRENFTQVSDYQKYITPNDPAVIGYLSTNDITSMQQSYASAVQWIWVSDLILHGKSEYWMMPSAFIEDTPNDPDNPVSGNMVSDCESQAYTLVSLLEALGTSKTNVRVVVGEVDFSGEIGGHAWVQIYQNNQWFELDATSGPFWDDEDEKLVSNSGFSFNYFKTHPYPVLEYWAFFNDQYYYNPHNQKKSPNLPIHWLVTS